MNSDKVRYAGVIRREQKRRAYAEAAVTVTASRVQETFCLVLAESMSCGTPVVSLDNWACPGVIDYGVTGFYVSELNDLPEAIEKATNLDRKIVRTTAVARYSLECMAKGYEQLYEQNL